MRHKTRRVGFGLLLVVSIISSVLWSAIKTRSADSHLQATLAPLWTSGIISDGVGPANIVVTDLNKDNVQDIVACSAGSLYVLNETAEDKYDTVWYGEVLPCGKFTVSDRDSNGVKEIYVAASDSTPRVVIYDGTTYGELGELALTGETSISDLEVAEVDGDGAAELVLVTSSATYVFDVTTLALEWQASGKGGVGVAIGDIEGDSDNEIVVNGSPAHVLNGRLHVEEWGYAGGFGSDLDAGDVDGDGKAELVLINGGGYSDGLVQAIDAESMTVKWQAGHFGMQIVKLADTSGDGTPEVLVGDGQWGSVWGYQGVSGAQLWSIANPEHGVFGIGAGDANNDGVNEVIWGAGLSSSGRDVLYIGNWATQAIEWESDDLDGPLLSAAGDLDGDGQVEIVMASRSTNSGYGGGTVRVYDGVTHQVEWSTMLAGGYHNFHQVAVGQVDGDPALEIVVGGDNWYDTRLTVLDGITHELQWQSPALGGGPPRALEVVNLDADPIDEIVVGLSTQQVQVFQGATPIIEWSSSSLGSEILDIATGDLDGNGVLDLAVLSNAQVEIFEAGTWVQHSYTAPSNSRRLAITNADLSGSGELLIVTSSWGSGSELQARDANFELLWQYYLGSNAIYGLAAGNLDGDGDNEFVVVGGSESGMYVSGPSVLLIGSQVASSYWIEYQNSRRWGTIYGTTIADVNADGQGELIFGADSLIQVNWAGRVGQLPPQLLRITKTGSGGGTVMSSPPGINCGGACQAQINAGTTVTLTASADALSTFSGWSGACSGMGPCVVTMDGAKTVTATFMRQTFTLTVARDGSGTGSVASSPPGIACGADCQEGYTAGTVVTLTAAADTNMLFAGWSGACSGMGPCIVIMDGAKAVTATFDTEGSITPQGSMMYYGGQLDTRENLAASAVPTTTQLAVFTGAPPPGLYLVGVEGSEPYLNPSSAFRLVNRLLRTGCNGSACSAVNCAYYGLDGKRTDVVVTEPITTEHVYLPAMKR